jgi:hypothetical protein
MSIRQIIWILAVSALLVLAPIGADAQSRGDQAVALAMDHFRANAGLSLSIPAETFLSEQCVTRATDRIRFDQYYQGLKVFEGRLSRRSQTAASM